MFGATIWIAFDRLYLMFSVYPTRNFDLPLEERWLAGVHGQVPAHSSGLSEGLAVTLAIMGARGEALTVAGGVTLRQQAELIVSELLGRANQDMKLWVSLSYVLPLLAEGSPGRVPRSGRRRTQRRQPRRYGAFC